MKILKGWWSLVKVVTNSSEIEYHCLKFRHTLFETMKGMKHATDAKNDNEITAGDLTFV